MASASRLLRDDTLSVGACAELVWLQRSQRRAGYMAGLSTVTFRELIAEPHTMIPLIAARQAAHQIVEEHFDELLYIEYTGINCWDRHAIIEPHYDSNKPHLAQRHFSALVYLNDQNDSPAVAVQQDDEAAVEGFDGGSFVFEAAACGLCDVRPRAGRLLAFASGAEHVHWVERVVGGGERFVLTLWFTRDEAHSEDQLLRAVGPRQARPHLSTRDAEVARAALARHGMALRGRLHDSPDSAVAAAPEGSTRRACRYGSLNELMQLAAFSLWRRGQPLGRLLEPGLLEGRGPAAPASEVTEVQADPAIEAMALWAEWREYLGRLKHAYVTTWLPAWMDHGYFHAPPGGWPAL